MGVIIGWAILALYLIGWAGFSVTISRFMEKGSPSKEATDKALTVALAMIIATAWPLVIPGGWVYRKVFAEKHLD